MLPNRYLFCVLLLVLVLPSSGQERDTKSLKDILSEQGFSGLLQGKITFKLLGDMSCKSKVLQVYYYTWEETNPPGKAIHFSQRLIFIHKNRYVGQYAVPDGPSLIRPNLLRFPDSKEDSVNCDETGLPKSITLDGESSELFR